MPVRAMLTAAALLMGFAIAGTWLVSFTYLGTRERIVENERLALAARLGEVLPEGSFDNVLVDDTLTLNAPTLAPAPVTVYRARRAGEPVAVIVPVVAPDGYGGPIRLLVGISVAGEVTGVRVVAHSETPGLGDPIEAERSDWIRGFEGRSLGNPPPARWTVKKDGGEFDQLTSATITPRAVVKAVARALAYFQEHREALLAPTERS